MKVLILAGGFATRLWPLTEKRAKPLLKLAGKPIISHIIDRIPPEMEVIISTNMVFSDDFNNLKKEHPERKLEVFIEDSGADASKKGALAATADVIKKHEIKEPVLLIAGDNYFDFSINDFVKAYDGKPMLAVFDTGSLEQAKQFGVVSVAGDRITQFQEKPEHPLSTMVSTGCYIFPPVVFSEIIEFAKKSKDNLGGIFEHLLGRHEIKAFPFAGRWIDIGSFESYIDAHKELFRKEEIPASSNVENTTIGESVSIGENCRIEGSMLENCLIGNNCEISDCHIRNSVIDNGCRLKGIDLDHKMIREGTHLGI